MNLSYSKQKHCQGTGCYVNQKNCEEQEVPNIILLLCTLASLFGSVTIIVLYFRWQRQHAEQPNKQKMVYGILFLSIGDLMISAGLLPFYIIYAVDTSFRQFHEGQYGTQNGACGIGLHPFLCGFRAFMGMSGAFCVFLSSILVVYTIYIYVYEQKTHGNDFVLYKLSILMLGAPILFGIVMLATNSFVALPPNPATVCFIDTSTGIGTALMLISFQIPYTLSLIAQVILIAMICYRNHRRRRSSASDYPNQKIVQSKSIIYLFLFPLASLISWSLIEYQRLAPVINVQIKNHYFSDIAYTLANLDGIINALIYGIMIWTDKNKNINRKNFQIFSLKTQPQKNSLTESLVGNIDPQLQQISNNNQRDKSENTDNSSLSRKLEVEDQDQDQDQDEIETEDNQQIKEKQQIKEN